MKEVEDRGLAPKRSEPKVFGSGCSGSGPQALQARHGRVGALEKTGVLHKKERKDRCPAPERSEPDMVGLGRWRRPVCYAKRKKGWVSCPRVLRVGRGRVGALEKTGVRV